MTDAQPEPTTPAKTKAAKPKRLRGTQWATGTGCLVTLTPNESIPSLAAHGYPEDTVLRCCRTAGHAGDHIAMLPVGGVSRVSWNLIPPTQEATPAEVEEPAGD